MVVSPAQQFSIFCNDAHIGGRHRERFNGFPNAYREREFPRGYRPNTAIR
jgi:hypothetical protein